MQLDFAVIYAPTVELALMLKNICDLTVEAEYGSVVVVGRRYTAAHHQPLGSEFAGTHVGGQRRAPCNDEYIPKLDAGSVVLVSHLDLDTIGGVLRAADQLPNVESFWALAEFVDTKGPHMLNESGASEKDQEFLYAWWAWNAKQPRLGLDKIEHINGRTEAAGEMLTILLTWGEFSSKRIEFIEEGRKFRQNEAELNAATYMNSEGSVIIRRAQSERQFVNHLYTKPSGEVKKGVCTYNHFTGVVTISLAQPVVGVSCRDIVQSLWGPTAGGHDGIAGSPRGQVMTWDDAMVAAHALAMRL